MLTFKSSSSYSTTSVYFHLKQFLTIVLMMQQKNGLLFKQHIIFSRVSCKSHLETSKMVFNELLLCDFLSSVEIDHSKEA